MKKTTTLLVIMLSIILFTNCEKNDNTPAIEKINYVGLESGFTIGVAPSGTTSQEIKIATSTSTGSDRTFSISVDTNLTTADPSAYSIPSSVTVPANSNIGIFNVEVVGANVSPSGDDILVIGFTSEEDDLFISEPISLNLQQVCPGPELILEMTFDQYPEEAYWQLYDINDVLLFQSGIDASGSCYAETPSTRTFCIPPGEYQFLMGDCYGDGGTAYKLAYDGNILYSSTGINGTGEVINITIN